MIWYHVCMKKLYLCMTAAAGLCIGARADVPFHTGEVFGKAVKVAEGSAGSGRCVNVAGDLLYVGGKETLGVYSLSGDPLRPKLLGEAKDIAASESLCRQLGIEYRVFDCADEYEAVVLEYFRSEYLAGRTPNPCVRCKALMKFGVLPQMVRKSGIAFDRFATGHYAQTEEDAAGRTWLCTSRDPV